MSSRTMIVGFLVSLSAVGAACSSATPTTTRPAGTGGSSSNNAGSGSTVGGSTAQGGSTSVGGSTVTTGGSDAGGSSPIAGSSSVGGSSGGDTSVGGSSTFDPCLPIDSVKALPLAVDGPFIPGGYFAGPNQDANITGIMAGTCDTPPSPATSFGMCHKFSFKAGMLGDPVPPATTGGAYGGVYWLAGSAGNWGTAAGANVAPGAQTVKFRAWGATGTEVVSFNVGGVTGTTCLDSVSFGTMGAMKITLTTTPTDYVFPLAGQTYPKGVIGGFVWSTEVKDTTSTTTFYVDNIRWTADAT